MAVTSIWTVKSHVGTAINYIINPEKTTAKLLPDRLSVMLSTTPLIPRKLNR